MFEKARRFMQLNARPLDLADGAWAITWDWHAYPETWPVAKNWWRGDVAVKNVRFVRETCGKI